MIKRKTIFDNLFDAERITPARLLEFGWAVYTALISANKDGQYTALIARLLIALTALKNELADIEENLSKQKNSTLSVKSFIAGFAEFMVGNEYTIAKALGGKDTNAFRTFYPFGKSEYVQANQTTMPALTARVEKAGATYPTELGTALATAMQGFATDYTTTINTQRLQKKNVRSELAEKNTAFVQAQWALTCAVHTVAATNMENTGVSAAIFPFDMLFTQPKHKRVIISEVLGKNETKQVLKRNINTAAALTCRNTSEGSAVIIWLAANPADAPANAITINAGRTKIIKATKLGNLNTNTYLMVKNMSDESEGSLQIAIAGLSKQNIEAPAAGTGMGVVRA